VLRLQEGLSWCRLSRLGPRPPLSGKPSLLGRTRCVRACGSSSSGVLYPGYPSNLAGPPGSSGEQVLSSLALDVAKSSLACVVGGEEQQFQVCPSPLAAAPATYRQQLASRQPPTADTETAAAEGPTIAHKFFALFWYVCILRLAISTHVYCAKNATYFLFNSWLRFHRPCRLLWGFLSAEFGTVVQTMWDRWNGAFMPKLFPFVRLLRYNTGWWQTDRQTHDDSKCSTSIAYKWAYLTF